MHIKVIVPKEGTFEFSFDKETVTVGRSQKNDLPLPYTGVSSTHISITDRGGDLFITDLNSTNGVFIDDSPITPGEETAFSPFQKVFLGELIEIAVESTSEIPVSTKVNAGTPSKTKSDSDNQSANLGSMKAASKKSEKKFKFDFSALAIVAAGLVLFFIFGPGSKKSSKPKQQAKKIKSLIPKGKAKN